MKLETIAVHGGFSPDPTTKVVLGIDESNV